MKQNLWERFLMWVCDTFGHKPDQKEIWRHDGKAHTHCKRCSKVITATYDMMYGCTDWE